MKFWEDNPLLATQLISMLEAGCTDSDLEDFASINKLDETDVFRFAGEYKAKGTPCEGCVHCQHSSAMYPCIICSRKYHKDYYVSFQEADAV